MDQNSRFSFQTSYNLCPSISWEILKLIWIWSDITCPFTNFMPNWLHNSRNRLPLSARILPNSTFYNMLKWRRRDTGSTTSHGTVCSIHAQPLSLASIRWECCGLSLFIYSLISTPIRLNLVEPHRSKQWFNRSGIIFSILEIYKQALIKYYFSIY